MLNRSHTQKATLSRKISDMGLNNGQCPIGMCVTFILTSQQRSNSNIRKGFTIITYQEGKNKILS